MSAADGDVEPNQRLSRAERIDRSRARAWALQIHYRWESGGSTDSLLDALVDTIATRRIKPSRVPFVRALLRTLDEHLPEIDGAIQGALENWSLERLSSIDRGVLRLGAGELLFGDGVPPKVAIQEAIRVAEAYGGAESPRFVNGVLDALYKGRAGGR